MNAISWPVVRDDANFLLGRETGSDPTHLSYEFLPLLLGWQLDLDCRFEPLAEHRRSMTLKVLLERCEGVNDLAFAVRPKAVEFDLTWLDQRIV